MDEEDRKKDEETRRNNVREIGGLSLRPFKPGDGQVEKSRVFEGLYDIVSYIPEKYGDIGGTVRLPHQHKPKQIGMEIRGQAPGKLVPEAIGLRFCESCGLVFFADRVVES